MRPWSHVLPRRGYRALARAPLTLPLLRGSLAALLTTAALASAAPRVFAQPAPPDSGLVARRWQLENELQEIAIVERKLMMPMRDGIRLATDIYRPRDAAGPVPTILSKTPYNFNHWDVRNRAPRDMSRVLSAVRAGYAYVEQNERGHFFSEGNWDILGPPRTDGDDAISWIAAQPWSNGKVGAMGCSSTAEWQMGVAALGNPAFGAMIAQGFGAGVGRVGRFYEQGNWYRGGAVQMLFIAWLYGQQNQVRPTFPPNTPQEDLVRAAKAFDLAPQLPAVDWSQALRHLPVQDIFRALDGPRGIFADSMPVPTGGRMIQRTPDDSAWYRGGLYHDDMPFHVPALWFMSWYDVSTAPNLELFSHVRERAAPDVAGRQYAVIAPVLHCAYTRATENTIVGERSMGDARLDYDALMGAWFDLLLKGEANGLLDTLPRVRYFTMGRNVWQSSDSWPPRGAAPVTYFLASGGNANTLNGDGVLAARAPASDHPDRFTYDPADPVPSYGGNVCCTGNAVQGGSFDQRAQELRPDILVYSTEPLAQGVEVSGPVELVLYVSSDAKDTDFTVKLIDVAADGRAWNLDETIQRMRYREGYDRTVWMEQDEVVRVVLGPMQTSNYFAPGHRIRIEVSSSNFPRFDRNLNTGGNNYDETAGVVARNVVHHSRRYPSALTLSVVKR
ncbi:MAG TPA: CocE/NonD family hydrolase [Longimicrobiales bacterium]|nr:CocE/NonD family hydrolase [Longimicrobiales bacterium]